MNFRNIFLFTLLTTMQTLFCSKTVDQFRGNNLETKRAEVYSTFGLIGVNAQAQALEFLDKIGVDPAQQPKLCCPCHLLLCLACNASECAKFHLKTYQANKGAPAQQTMADATQGSATLGTTPTKAQATNSGSKKK